MDDKHKHIQLAEMERRVLNAQAELAEAQRIADEFGFTFAWRPENSSAFTYHGAGSKNWQYSDSCSDLSSQSEELLSQGEWVSSGTNC